MARAAVLPKSPAKRGTRTVPRAAMKTTAASAARAKASAEARKKTIVKAPVADSDSDDTDDELDILTKQPDTTSTRGRGRPAARPATKATSSTAATRGKKSTPVSAQIKKDHQSISEDGQDTDAEPKKRPGRPKKTTAASTPAPAVPAPKARGRPKGSINKTSQPSTKTSAARKNTRQVPEPEVTSDTSEAKRIVIATNSTTMRSNILRGPAKKKTVTFQDVMDSGSEEDGIMSISAPIGNGQAPKTAGKAGFGATPVRKAGATRGRKPAAQKDAPQPLSPKKTKQMAKTLSAYASSDGEEDELAAAKEDPNSPVRLLVHSPVKQNPENLGLASPVRKINFTPKKASQMIDENGEPKDLTPKHGSTGLSSPVRKINFTPKRSQNAQPDGDSLSLPVGKQIDFSDSMFMSTPARRPELSPFKFSHADSPNRGLSQSLNAPNLTPGPASPLKMSPRKGKLSASLSQSPAKTSTPGFPARTSLFQSPAKKVASPFKSSLFAPKSSILEQSPQNQDASTTPTSLPKASPIPESVGSEQDGHMEMVDEVSRDIFEMELRSYQPIPESPLSKQSLNLTTSQTLDDMDDDHFEINEMPHDVVPNPVAMSDPTEVLCEDPIENNEILEEDEIENKIVEHSSNADINDKLAVLEEEVQQEPQDFGTVCFNTMESLQAPFKAFEHEEDVFEDELVLEDTGSVQDDVSEMDPDNDDTLAFETIEGEVEDFAGPIEPPSVQYKAHDMEAEDTQMPHSDVTLNFDTLERIHASIEPASDVDDNEDAETESTVRFISQPDEVEESQDTDNDEPTVVPAEATLSILFNPGLEDEANDGDQRTHPFERMPSIPPPASTPPVARGTPRSLQESVRSQKPIYDINLEPRMDVEDDSIFEITQQEIPTPGVPSPIDTPHNAGRRKSNHNVDLGFTPLAQKFGHWETNTPSQNRSGRPRRRGVFSLVGPLEKASEPSTPENGDVSYPDLSPTPLPNTPSLFAELPLQERASDSSMSPVSVVAVDSPTATECPDTLSSPSKSDIFEDTDHGVLEEQHRQIRSRQISSTPEPIEQEEGNMPSDDEKENSDVPTVPATPIRSFPEPRTVHTVSKVPLKGEGDVSPLKIPRKRGHSLSGASPTRSSPRVRKPAFRPFVDNEPILSPTRKSPRVDRSPSPKRRCSAPRRSLGASKSPSVVRSPSKSPVKSPRKAKPASQALRGAVVHVDVHTTEGEDASGIFVELLQQMGARCVMSWSWNGRSSLSPVDGADPKDARVGITHVVYKDGGLRTLEKVKQASGLVKCVGVGWVLDCERENKWLDESPYVVDSSIVPRGGAKRRKSMEPRALSNVNGSVVQIAEPSTPSASGRRCGADRGAIDGFRKITPPSPQKDVPSTPTHQTSEPYNFPQTPGYNFANLDAIGMSPATPYFLSNRNQIVQQSCPPKQSNKGLFPVSRPSFSLEEETEEDARRQQRARMEAARRKTLFYRPAVESPLKK